jgi:hypothetical protein
MRSLMSDCEGAKGWIERGQIEGMENKNGTRGEAYLREKYEPPEILHVELPTLIVARGRVGPRGSTGRDARAKQPRPGNQW